MLRYIKVTLEAAIDQEMGVLGLFVKGSSSQENTNSANEGELIAHDLIEHVNGIKNIGGIDDELEALGAIWYVRGQHGQLRRDNRGSFYTIEENISSDITRMFRDYVMGQYVNTNYSKGKRPVYDDNNLKEIIECAKNSKWRAEFNDEDQVSQTQFDTFLKISLRRMRVGYSKARRKYEKHSQFCANNIFWNIVDALKPYCKPEYEGQQFTLRYNATSAHCEEYFEAEY